MNYDCKQCIHTEVCDHIVEQPMCYKYLTPSEAADFSRLLDAGLSIRAIQGLLCIKRSSTPESNKINALNYLLSSGQMADLARMVADNSLSSTTHIIQESILLDEDKLQLIELAEAGYSFQQALDVFILQHNMKRGYYEYTHKESVKEFDLYFSELSKCITAVERLVASFQSLKQNTQRRKRTAKPKDTDL